LKRPVAALADAQRVDDDFVVARTLPGSVQRLCELFDWSALRQRFLLEELWQSTSWRVLRLAIGQSSAMAICTGALDGGVTRVLFETDPAAGFRSRCGIELPVAGLRLWQVVDDVGQVHDLRGEEVHVLPR